jgi:hypothetical protein
MDIPPVWATHLMTSRDGEVKWWWSRDKHENVKTEYTFPSRSPLSYWERAGWIVEEIDIQLEND